MNKKLTTLFLILFSSLLGITILEVTIRVFLPYHIAFLDNVDHRLKPDGADINRDGIRECGPDSFRAEDYNILFLGDSFTYGFNLPGDSAFPKRVEGLFRNTDPDKKVRSVNMGWPSASPLLCYRQLVDIGRNYKPDMVVLAVDMTDFHDDLTYYHYIERPGIYKLLNILPGTFLAIKKVIKSCSGFEPMRTLHGWLYHLPPERFFITNHPLSETRLFTWRIEKSMQAIQMFCRDTLKVPFVVVVYPRHFQYPECRDIVTGWETREYEVMGDYVMEPFAWFDSLKSEVGYPVYSLMDDFREAESYPLYFPDDPHWTTAGHRVAAAAIADILRKDYLEEE